MKELAKLAREHADKIWNTQDLSDISDFNIPLSMAVGMMEDFAKESNIELLERYNEAIEVLSKIQSIVSKPYRLTRNEELEISKLAEQTISKANGIDKRKTS